MDKDEFYRRCVNKACRVMWYSRYNSALVELYGNLSAMRAMISYISGDIYESVDTSREPRSVASYLMKAITNRIKKDLLEAGLIRRNDAKTRKDYCVAFVPVSRDTLGDNAERVLDRCDADVERVEVLDEYNALIANIKKVLHEAQHRKNGRKWSKHYDTLRLFAAGYTVNEIARLRDITPKAARQQVTQMLTSLREKLLAVYPEIKTGGGMRHNKTK